MTIPESQWMVGRARNRTRIFRIKSSALYLIELTTRSVRWAKGLRLYRVIAMYRQMAVVRGTARGHSAVGAAPAFNRSSPAGLRPRIGPSLASRDVSYHQPRRVVQARLAAAPTTVTASPTLPRAFAAPHLPLTG
jgi:hypothetical protein